MTPTRLVCAYDGSAAATAVLAWMRETSPVELVTLTLDLGQQDELEAVRDRALAAGAVRAHVLDVRESFARDYLLPALRAGAACEDGRPLGRALSRPLIARQLVDVARMESATVVAHGAWRDAADRARIDRAIRLVASPEIAVRAPLVEWAPTDEAMHAFLEARGLRVPPAASRRVVMNVWGRCVWLPQDASPPAAADVERDAPAAPGADAATTHGAGTTAAYRLTKGPDDAPETPAFVDVAFERGVPVGISGVTMPLLEILSSLDTIAGAHGVGRSERLAGQPIVREICESPAATVLDAAHAAIEQAVFAARAASVVGASTAGASEAGALGAAAPSGADAGDLVSRHAQVRAWYLDLVHDGGWASLTREACQAFIDRTQASVTGSVRVKLSRGTCQVVDVSVTARQTASASRAARAIATPVV